MKAGRLGRWVNICEGCAMLYLQKFVVPTATESMHLSLMCKVAAQAQTHVEEEEDVHLQACVHFKEVELGGVIIH